MVWDDVGAILVRLCSSVPLLYIGILMAIDPAGFVRFAEVLASVLRTFEHRLHGLQWQERLCEPDSARLPPRVRNAVRIAGLTLVAVALLPFAGLVN